MVYAILITVDGYTSISRYSSVKECISGDTEEICYFF